MIEKITNKFMGNPVWRRLWQIFRIPLVIILILFVGLVIYRIPVVMERQKTEEVVKKIQAQKLTLADVLGERLPPEPDPALRDSTVEGVDANQNGIRDDVELAIFNEYPNSAKTRAVLLQYALALQMEVVQPIINTETVTEVVREQSRAGSCVGDSLVPRKNLESARSYADVEKIFTFLNFVKDKQLNTDVRKKAQEDFVERIGSYSESENEICDIDLLALPN